ncbi:HAD family hydrolase [Yoonia sp.]|uniref:HAD family hydrolase n=1 Tax=Yoonia sp. TaxID=2212373 RepID=UPI0019EA6FD0|nr:HAD family hydrolase [Yoonia sp.]MBE0412485.1 HAD family hydrolase [Yoonia sp.]
MIKGIIFDKDGTLFDFNATWGAWAQAMLQAEAGDDAALFAALAEVLGFDPLTERFLPESVVIAGTVDTVADHLLSVIPQMSKPDLIARMNAGAAQLAQVEAVPLIPYFKGLRALGLRLGIATNDAEGPARAHLRRAGVIDDFDFIAGYDSGHGAKPESGQLLGFVAQTGIAPGECAMVGDSLHDLVAGRAAGMLTIGVLTGPARRPELAPHADVVLDTIAAIPDWLAAENLI